MTQSRAWAFSPCTAMYAAFFAFQAGLNQGSLAVAYVERANRSWGMSNED